MPSFLQTISSLFSGSNSARQSSSLSPNPPPRRRQPGISPTADAFSLPTHSPILDTDSPNIASSSSAAFSYPPTHSSYDYDYPMTSTGSSSGAARAGLSARAPPIRQNSASPILPLHHQPNSNASPLSPLASYPPLQHTWDRLRGWLSAEYTELGDTLNYGIQPTVISAIQMELGLPLPSAVRDSYLICDGQEVESSAGCSDGLFFGLTLLPLEDVLEEWRFWREVDEDPATGANERLRSVMRSIPDGYVRKEYSCRGWLPLVTDRAGNYLGIDLHPGDEGTYGQVIVFGRDFDTKVVMFKGEGEGGWGRWLAGFVDELENGEGYELGGTGDGSSGSEDDVGYESYFYSASGPGRDSGEGKNGGLRLTGEYKGWNVLEAWADRSVKKWIEAGLYKDDQPQPAPSPKLDVEVADATAVTNKTAAAEVPIPVLEEVQAAGSLHPLVIPAAKSDTTSPSTPRQPISPAPPTPTISVTVPPVPKPVPLPTTRDLLTSNSPSSSLPNSPRLSEDDPHLQKLNSAPTRQLNGTRVRPVSEDSTFTADGATAPLVGDTSFSSSHQAETSMTEATLLAPTAEDDVSNVKTSPGSSLVLLSTSPPPEDLDIKTPTTASFSSAAKKSSPPKPVPNGTPEPEVDATSAPEPPTKDKVDSRPGTPSSIGSGASKRVPKVSSHKKSTKSISKLFQGGTSSEKGSDDERSEKKDKRSSAFGTQFKSLVGSKQKERKKVTADVAV